MNRHEQQHVRKMAAQQMQGYYIIDDVDPKLALFEIRDGKCCDGLPFTRLEDGATKPDGFYFAELMDGHIRYDEVYGPYPNVDEALIAAEMVSAFTELERKGCVRTKVGKNGVQMYQVIHPLNGKPNFLDKIIAVLAEREGMSADGIAKILRERGETFTDEALELALKLLSNEGYTAVERVQ